MMSRTPPQNAMHHFSHRETALLQASFRKVNRDSEHAADLFFTRLFDFQPSLRALVTTPMQEQKREFIRLLGTTVHRLDSFDLVRDHMRDLALCHPDFCANDDHHYAVGAALFWMLEQLLGEDFSSETYGAWIKVYRLLSDDMKLASRELPLAG